MCSTASSVRCRRRSETSVSAPLPMRTGFDPAMAGRRAECDGGGPEPGGTVGSRDEFAGTLTGEYFEEGDPPWRWYLLADLTRKPTDYAEDSVWCESGFVFLVD
jgi:hypothetical protein